MNWQQQIEAQIHRAELIVTDSPSKNHALQRVLESTKALLDVAVAAEQAQEMMDTGVGEWRGLIEDALDKLREAGDE